MTNFSSHEEAPTNKINNSEKFSIETTPNDKTNNIFILEKESSPPPKRDKGEAEKSVAELTNNKLTVEKEKNFYICLQIDKILASIFRHKIDPKSEPDTFYMYTPISGDLLIRNIESDIFIPNGERILLQSVLSVHHDQIENLLQSLTMTKLNQLISLLQTKGYSIACPLLQSKSQVDLLDKKQLDQNQTDILEIEITSTGKKFVLSVQKNPCDEDFIYFIILSGEEETIYSFDANSYHDLLRIRQQLIEIAETHDQVLIDLIRSLYEIMEIQPELTMTTLLSQHHLPENVAAKIWPKIIISPNWKLLSNEIRGTKRGRFLIQDDHPNYSSFIEQSITELVVNPSEDDPNNLVILFSTNFNLTKDITPDLLLQIISMVFNDKKIKHPYSLHFFPIAIDNTNLDSLMRSLLSFYFSLRGPKGNLSFKIIRGSSQQFIFECESYEEISVSLISPDIIKQAVSTYAKLLEQLIRALYQARDSTEMQEFYFEYPLFNPLSPVEQDDYGGHKFPQPQNSFNPKRK